MTEIITDDYKNHENYYTRTNLWLFLPGFSHIFSPCLYTLPSLPGYSVFSCLDPSSCNQIKCRTKSSTFTSRETSLGRSNIAILCKERCFSLVSLEQFHHPLISLYPGAKVNHKGRTSPFEMKLVLFEFSAVLTLAREEIVLTGPLGRTF